MTSPDRKLARHRSKSNRRDARKDERRAYIRAVRRDGRAQTRRAREEVRS